MTEQFPKEFTVSEIFGFFHLLLRDERNYYVLAVIYGIGISLLSLALPISVQMVVNTVAHTALTTTLIVLCATLFGLLLVGSLLNALRIHLMDIFGRRFYARMMAEISLRSIYALNPFFEDENKGPLFNRYFDILIVQRTVPQLLVGGFTIVLQAAVGFALVSMYHPLFLAFNLVVLVLIWLIWVTWGGRAMRSAVELSHRKHAAAAFIEGLGASNGFFKSERHIGEALDQTDNATKDYIGAHVKHFRHHYAQTICFLFLYAIASAMLLGLGGWLVIRGELSLGQLVAAELVMSAVFYSLSQSGTYLTYFYELCGALEELSQFYRVEQEEPVGEAERFTGNSELVFVNAAGDARGRQSTLNFVLPNNARILSVPETHGMQRELTNFLKRHDRPASGFVTLGGQDIMGITAHELRQHIIVLDRPNAIEMTIREYLKLSGEKGSSHKILEALRIVGLDSTIAQLNQGLDTRIAATGWPLTITETMQLKLAAAIIANPVVLVLGQLYDTMPDDNFTAALDALQEDRETTILYFSSRPRDCVFDQYLFLGETQQILFDSYADLARKVDAAKTGSSGGPSIAPTALPAG